MSVNTGAWTFRGMTMPPNWAGYQGMPLDIPEREMP